MRRAKIFLLLTCVVCLAAGSRAAQSGDITWNKAADRVSADIQKQPLFPVLETIAHQTGWHIFVEPEAARMVDVKFSNLHSGEALKKLLGNLNFSFVPKTNEASELYVFITQQGNATRTVGAGTITEILE